MRSLASVEQENQNLFTAAALVLVQRMRTLVQISAKSVAKGQFRTFTPHSVLYVADEPPSAQKRDWHQLLNSIT